VEEENVSIELNSVSIARKHDLSICSIIEGNNSEKFEDVTSHMPAFFSFFVSEKRQQQMRLNDWKKGCINIISIMSTPIKN
jgi:hypothetical protein